MCLSLSFDRPSQWPLGLAFGDGGWASVGARHQAARAAAVDHSRSNSAASRPKVRETRTAIAASPVRIGEPFSPSAVPSLASFACRLGCVDSWD
jgi:hypothetical protein